MQVNRKKTVLYGITFDSQTEAEFYGYLLYREKLGEIKDLQVHPKYVLLKPFKRYGKSYRGVNYIADFSYVELPGGQPVVVDVKGFAYEDAMLKRKWFAEKYPSIRLDWVAKSKKYSASGWIDYDELQKRRRERKKLK